MAGSERGKSVWERKIGRRQAIGLGLGVAGIAAVGFPFRKTLYQKGFEKVVETLEDQLIQEQALALQEAQKPWEQIVIDNKDRLGDLSLGFSFSPQRYLGIDDLSPTLFDDPDLDKKGSLEQQLQDAADKFRFGIRTMGIKKMRYALSWDSTPIDLDGKPDLRLHEPFLRIMQEEGVHVMLNVGIKTFGSPEQHIPQDFPKEHIPSAGSVITPEMPIAQAFLGHLRQILPAVKDKGFVISGLQIENEARVKAGLYEFTLSRELVVEEAKIGLGFFPDADMLINTIEVPDPGSLFKSRKTEETLDLLRAIKPLMGKGRLILGQDVYHFPGSFAPPPVKGQHLDTVFVGKYSDKDLYKKALAEFDVEITEMQTEPWFPSGDAYDRDAFALPGNDDTELKYLLLRCLEVTNPYQDPNKRSVIRLWGLEYLLHKFDAPGSFTDKHREIFHIIAAINNVDPQIVDKSIALATS